MIFNPNLAVGVDIEEISRFEEFGKDNPFLDKIYTEKEKEYCFSKKKPAQHLAVRFAGKEAVIKALNSLEYSFSNFKKIEISNSKNGVPKVKINQQGFEEMKIAISLSHCKDKAIAFAVINGQAIR